MQEPLNVKNQNQMVEPETSGKESINLHVSDDKLSDSIETRKKYKDVADAAQAAFESAAYAAAAARAAVELSRSESHDPPPPRDHDHHQSPRKVMDGHDDDDESMEEINKSGSENEVDAHSLNEEVGFDESENEADYEDKAKSNEDFEEIYSKNDGGIKAVSGSKMHSNPLLDLEKKPISVRTKRVWGY